jgi:hypothetical protein
LCESSSSRLVRRIWCSGGLWRCSAPAGLTEEGLKKLKFVDELLVGGFGNRFVSFTYLKTLRIHFRTLRA